MSSLSLSLSLRVAAIFEIFILALIGIILPFLILRQLAKKTIFQSESTTYESHAESRDEENVNFNMKSMLQGLFFMSMKSVSAGVMLGVAMVR
jgi:NADH:ubiquinone oxidoreductase subunit 3 (subunit A)